MTRIALFVCFQLAVSLFAIRRGGPPERAVAWMLLAAMAASIGVGLPPARYRAVAEWQLLIDAALFIGVVLVALRANRFWPIWLAALQLIAIGIHGVRWADPLLLPYAYYKSFEKVAYPMCLALILGTYHYLRRQRIEGRAPAAWAPFRW